MAIVMYTHMIWRHAQDTLAKGAAEVAEAAAEMAAEAVAVAMAMSTRPTDEGRTDGCVAAGRAGDKSPVPPS